MRVASIFVSGTLLLLSCGAQISAGEAQRPPRPLSVDIDPASGPGTSRPRPTGLAPTKGPPSTAGSVPAKPTATAGKPPATANAKPGESEPAIQAIDHDTVILDNKQCFQGTVLSNQEDPDHVSINTGNGVMILRRDRIKEVFYGLTARMGRVKADDLAGLVDLAHWCRNNRRNAEALVLLTKAVALADCDLPTRGLYAQLVDEIHGAEAALPLYIAYRNAGGANTEIITRLRELSKARQLWEEQMRALGLDPGASSESGTPVAAATSSQVEEGYEKYTWVGDNPKFANPVTISQTTLVTPEGPRKVLQVDYLPNPDNTAGVDKAAVVLRRQLNQELNKKFTLLAANRSEKSVRIAIAVKTGAEWTYFESPAQSLPSTSSGQEFQQLTFDLGATTFKAASSGWAHSATITGLNQVRELQILIHNGRNEGSLWLAGIAFSSGE